MKFIFLLLAKSADFSIESPVAHDCLISLDGIFGDIQLSAQFDDCLRIRARDLLTLNDFGRVICADRMMVMAVIVLVLVLVIVFLV